MLLQFLLKIEHLLWTRIFTVQITDQIDLKTSVKKNKTKGLDQSSIEIKFLLQPERFKFLTWPASSAHLHPAPFIQSLKTDQNPYAGELPYLEINIGNLIETKKGQDKLFAFQQWERQRNIRALQENIRQEKTQLWRLFIILQGII